MQTAGRFILLVGSVMAAVGGVLMLSDKVPWLGKLPGDITIRKENWQITIPLTTSLLLSFGVSLVFWLVGQIRGK